MKAKKTVYYILMYLPFVIVLIALPYLPEKIPAHYGFDNQVDRWGSKYETLLFPIISLLMGYFLLGMAKLKILSSDSLDIGQLVWRLLFSD